MTKKKDVPLEQTIKEYFDQYGAILVGMHQDLERQQAKVDGKLADAESRVTSTVDQLYARTATSVSGVENVRTQLLEEVNTKLSDSENRISALLGQFNTRSAKVTANVEQMRDQVQAAMANHHKMTEAALKEYRATNAKQQELYEQRRIELLALHQQVIN